MLHSALKIKNLKELLIKENLSVKVIVGGAPLGSTKIYGKKLMPMVVVPVLLTL